MHEWPFWMFTHVNILPEMFERSVTGKLVLESRHPYLSQQQQKFSLHQGCIPYLCQTKVDDDSHKNNYLGEEDDDEERKFFLLPKCDCWLKHCSTGQFFPQLSTPSPFLSSGGRLILSMVWKQVGSRVVGRIMMFSPIPNDFLGPSVLQSLRIS